MSFLISRRLLMLKVIIWCSHFPLPNGQCFFLYSLSLSIHTINQNCFNLNYLIILVSIIFVFGICNWETVNKTANFKICSWRSIERKRRIESKFKESDDAKNEVLTNFLWCQRQFPSHWCNSILMRKKNTSLRSQFLPQNLVHNYKMQFL